MKIFKNALLLIAVLILSYLTSPYFGNLYSNFFPGATGFWVNITSLAGMFFAFEFFLFLIFTAFGDVNKYKWIGAIMVPVIILGNISDIRRVHFPIILILIGWVIGLGISKLIATLKQKQS